MLSIEIASLVAQRLKHLPPMWETWVRSLDWEDPLEKEMATHSSILAWRIPWTEEPGGLQSTGVTKSRTQLSDFTFTFFSFIKSSKILCVSLEVEPRPCLKAIVLFLHCSSLASASPFPWIATVWKASMPRIPTGSFLVSLLFKCVT